MSRSLVEILIKTSAFCLNQTLNVYLCPTRHIDCSLMRILKSFGHKDLILQLLLEMRSSNKLVVTTG